MQWLYLFLFPLAYGLSDMLWIKLGNNVPFFKSIFLRSLISVALAFVAALMLDNIHTSNINSWLYAIAVALISVIGFLLFYKSLQQSESGANTVAVKGLNTIVAVVIAMVLSHKLDVTIVTATLLLLLGLCLLYITKNKNNKAISFYAIAAGIIWGISTQLYAKPVQEIGSFWFAFIVEFASLFVVSFILLFKRNRSSFAFTIRQYITLALIGFTTAAGTIFVTLAYNYHSPAIISIVGKFAILPPFLYAFLVLKQRLTVQKVIGIVLILIAIYLSIR